MNVVLKNQKISPRKLLPIVRSLQGLSVAHAVRKLMFTTPKGAEIVREALNSAIANAAHNHGVELEDLKIAEIYVNKGMMLKRYTQKAKGRGSRILKRYSHLYIRLQPTVQAQRGQ